MDALKRIGNIIPKRLWNKEIKKPCLKFNLRLSLIGLKSSLPSGYGYVHFFFFLLKNGCSFFIRRITGKEEKSYIRTEFLGNFLQFSTSALMPIFVYGLGGDRFCLLNEKPNKRLMGMEKSE